MRTGRSSSAGQRRFARSTTTPRRTATTPSRMSRPTQALRRRRQPEPSGFKKVLSAVLPTAAAKKATPSSKKGKAGGLALVAAAAGMAVKNRGKIAEMRRKDSGAGGPSPDMNSASAPPANPTV